MLEYAALVESPRALHDSLVLVFQQPDRSHLKKIMLFQEPPSFSMFLDPAGDSLCENRNQFIQDPFTQLSAIMSASKSFSMNLSTISK
jgi:hypothetical protein